MNRVNRLAIGAKIRAAKTLDSLAEKQHGDSQIVVALVLIAVAVGLCIIFRNTISETMASLFKTISKAITDLSSGIVS